MLAASAYSCLKSSSLLLQSIQISWDTAQNTTLWFLNGFLPGCKWTNLCRRNKCDFQFQPDFVTNYKNRNNDLEPQLF